MIGTGQPLDRAGFCRFAGGQHYAGEHQRLAAIAASSHQGADKSTGLSRTGGCSHRHAGTGNQGHRGRCGGLVAAATTTASCHQGGCAHRHEHAQTSMLFHIASLFEFATLSGEPRQQGTGQPAKCCPAAGCSGRGSPPGKSRDAGLHRHARPKRHCQRARWKDCKPRSDQSRC